MRLFTLILASAIVGTAAGAVWGYLETRPPALPGEDAGVASLIGPNGDIADGTAHIEIDNQEYNFGRMQRGTKRSHKFVITNTGGASLHLELGQPSCKCTVGELARDVLQPGESVDVDVTWKAQADAGPFRQWVPLTTNDPRSSRLELNIVGEITKPTGLTPSEFSFGKLSVGETRSATVYLMAFLQDNVEITKAQIASEEARPHFDIEVSQASAEELPDEKATAGVRLVVTAKPTLPIGRFMQLLELETNLPDLRELSVPIVGQIVGDVAIRGRLWSDEHGILKLGRVLSAEGKHADLSVLVRGENAADVKVEVAATDPPELVATLGEPKKVRDSLYQVPLRIEVPPGTRQMVHLNPNLHEPASVTLKTTHPKAPELVLDVRFTVE